MQIIRKHSSTSNILRVTLRNSSTGAGLTALTHSSSGLIVSTLADGEATATAYTQAASNLETITTLGTFAAPTSGKARFKEVDATNHPGLYEIQIADARFAVSGAKALRVCITGAANLITREILVQLTATDVDNATHGGLGNLDAAVSSRMATFTVPASFASADFTRLDAAITTRMATFTVPASFAGADFTRLDAAITTRMATFTVPASFATANFANLDAAVSSRSTLAAGAAMTLTSAYDAAKTAASQTSVNAIPTNPITSLAGIATSANITSLQTHGDGAWATATGFATVNPDNVGIGVAASAASAAAGSAASADSKLNSMPTAAANATALLDAANAVETGVTVRMSLRALLAAMAGVADGGNSNTIVLKNPAGDTVRLTLTVDTDGNRSASALNLG